MSQDQRDATSQPLAVDRDARWEAIQALSRRVASKDEAPTEIEAALCGAVVRARDAMEEIAELRETIEAMRLRSETRTPAWVSPRDRQPDLDGRLWAVLTERRELGRLTGFVPLYEYYHFDNGWATDDRILFWLDYPLHPLPKVPHE